VKQGGTGIAAIGRRFRIVDDDGGCHSLLLRVYPGNARCGVAASSAAAPMGSVSLGWALGR
jgi:hypothetical protein